ncbi:MAG: alpha-1,2-fucosyltransferase [Bacteroidota bacterium]
MSLSANLNTPLYFDAGFANKGNDDFIARAYELANFNHTINIAVEQLINSFLRPGSIQRLFNKMGIHKNTIYTENSLKFNPSVFHIKPPAYLNGFWQSENYFKVNEALVRENLTFKQPLNSQSQHLANILANQGNAVSVHIRRGDYVSSQTTNQIHGICSVRYYQQAIAALQSKLDNPYFYFFSDEPEWVEENIIFGLANCCLISHNQGPDSWQDMALMSKCKHHIIANSSFSWWGAWLNPAKEKIVIAPQNWFNTQTDYFNDTDIVPKNWIKMANA